MKPIPPTPAQAGLIQKAFDLAPGAPLPLLRPVDGGLTNTQFRFTLGGADYLIREPGQDSFTYINRWREKAVYDVLRGRFPTDELLALEPESGRKITRFWEGARSCDPTREADVLAAMALLRNLHDQKLSVDYSYSICYMNRTFFGWKRFPSLYPDYEEVKTRCMDMEPILARYGDRAVLSHCDTVADNFLFIPGEGGEQLRLIDWEYAGMHDPAIDVAMFANDGCFEPARTDWLMEVYLGKAPDPCFRLRVYGYLALTGLCLSNWAERQKLEMGEDYTEYADGQYGRASLYSRLFWELLPRVEERS